MEMVYKSKNALVFVGAVSALLYVVNFFSGQLLSVVFVVPGLSAIVTGFTVPLFLIISYLVTGRIGSITLVWSIYSIAAVPTALMGPPGFYKIFIGFFAGLTFDIVIRILKGSRKSFYIGFVAYTIVMMVLFLALLKLFDLPGFNITINTVAILTIIFLIEGFLSIHVGEKVSRRINDIGVIKM